MQSRRMDIADYTAKLKVIADKQTNELLHIQTTEYIEFVNRLVETANIMNKNFYVIIPLEYSVLPTKKGMFTRLFRNVEAIDAEELIKNLDERRLQLDERVGSVTSNLSTIGLRVARLTTEQIIELLYNSYNFDTAPSIDASQLPNVAITEKVQQ
jgi:predicted HAD superfamily phosphohydrolase